MEWSKFLEENDFQVLAPRKEREVGGRVTCRTQKNGDKVEAKTLEPLRRRINFFEVFKQSD